MDKGGAKTPHKKKPRKAYKQGRHFRINGENRAEKPMTATSTKYVRSGGPRRMAAKKAKAHGCNDLFAHLGKHGERAH